MLRGVRLSGILVAGAALCLACTGLVTPTTAPMQPIASPSTETSATPTSGADATPRPSASPSPSPSPSLSPEPSTPAPSASASPSRSGAQAGTFLEVIRDDMSDPRSGFQTGDFEHHRVAYEEGQLVVEIKGPGRSTWTMREFGDWPLADVEARILRPDPAAGDFYGLTCGRSNDDFYAGLLDGLGGTALLRVVNGQATVLLRDDTPVPEAAVAGPIDLRLSCSGTDSGDAPGLALSVGDRVVASAADPAGFVSFLRGGFYLESGARPEGSLMSADDPLVMVGVISDTGPGPSPPTSGDPAADALRRHVPETLRDLCLAVIRADLAATVAVDCPTPDVPVATYLQYADPTTMMADYDALVAAHADATGSSCELEPSEGPYTVDGIEAGRLLCVVEEGVATVYWTDERVWIMGQAEAANASFEGLYAWWLGAGPLP